MKYKALSIVMLAVLATAAQAQRTFETDILAETFGYNEDTKRSVSLDDLHQGCSARDCIPSIDNPKYVAADKADFLSDDDVVLTLSIDGIHHAYPRRIMDHHEIVNEVIADTPVAVTWCPLCGSAVGIYRTVAGTVTEFGVSGVLYNSDLVMYDRTTNTLWEQIGSKGIVGPLTDVELELFPVGITRWSKWKAAHPDTLVLSPATGKPEDYEKEYYADYRGSDGIMFPVLNTSDRVHPKTVVYGYQIDGKYIAYSEDLLSATGSHAHEFNGRTLVASLDDDGTAMLRDPNSGENYKPVRLFWFAWYTFHPETELVN